VVTIDNAPAEQAIRPPAIGRRNWLQIAGDGALHSAAVLLSVAASAKQHGVNPWVHVKCVLTASAARPRAADFSDLLPDGWVTAAAVYFPSREAPSQISCTRSDIGEIERAPTN
jgi:hypothetical protein